jgi:hypothetical protein
VLSATAFSDSTISNRYLYVRGQSDTGRFYLKTLEGNPSIRGDERQDILNGLENPLTSFLSVAIDNKVYMIGEETAFKRKLSKQNNSLIFHATLPGNISVIQEIKFIKMPESNTADAVIITFSVVNNDTKAHDIRLRFVFDTHLYKSYKSGFKLESGEIVQSEKEFKSFIPSKIYMVDNVNTPLVKVYFSFSTQNNIKPYKVMLAGYNKFKKAKFEFVATPGASFAAGSPKIDSALGVYYNMGRLLPSQKATASSVIGIANVIKVEKLKIDAVMNAEKYNLSPPLTIRIKVKNSGNSNLKIVKAILKYPLYFKFKGEINQIQAITNLKSGKEHTFTWTFNYPLKKYATIVVSAKIKAYSNENKLIKKSLYKKIFLTAGKIVSPALREVSSVEVLSLLDNLVSLAKGYKLLDKELKEINFLIEKINLSSNINAFIAGGRLISNELLDTIRKKIAKIIYRIKKLNTTPRR